MFKDGKVWIAQNDQGENIFILPKMANRHGLVAGATGTGKTVTFDTNHEMAGKELNFTIELTDVRDA